MTGAAAGEIVAIVPAAGHGSRMGLSTPKQYLPLHGSMVLACTLERLCAVSAVTKIVLVVGQSDPLPVDLLPDNKLDVVIGGETRTESVLNGLMHVRDTYGDSGSVLVHDAARPCVRVADIEKLIIAVGETESGGLLAIPVHDTLKRSDQNQDVCATIDRQNVWRAVTPQLFRSRLLIEALTGAQQNQVMVTDEASAMEQAGYKPRLVRCEQDNIKITEPADMLLAQIILEAQAQE